MKVIAKNIKECRAVKALERARMDLLFWMETLKHWELEEARMRGACPWCGTALPESMQWVKKHYRTWVMFTHGKVIACHAEIERLVAEVEKERSQ